MKETDFQEIRRIISQNDFSKLFIGNTNNTLIQLFRYVFVGGIATVVDWGISYILFHLVFQRSYAVAANSLSFVAGLVVNYTISTFWVFKESKVNSRLTEFFAFAAIGLVGLLLTVCITRLFEVSLSSSINEYQIFAKILSTVVAFFWNFFARKYLLFEKS